MADAIIWADKLPDIIKKWILVIPMIIAAIGSGAGIYQTYSKGVALEKAALEKKNADIELERSLEQTAAVAEHLGKFVPKPEPKPVNIYKTDCNQCKGIMQQIVNEATKNHVIKSH